MEKKEEIKPAFELKELPTQTGMFIVDKEGKVYDQSAALMKLMNDIAEIKKAVC